MKIPYNPAEMTIMVVDDVATNIHVALNILEREDYRVIYAQSGPEALQLLKSEIPDLLLLDVMMPVMDGFTLCELLRKQERTKDIPVIFVTAKVEMDSIVRGFNVGGQDYITKPFNSRELLVRVENQLTLKFTKSQLQQEIEHRKEIQKNLEIANQTKSQLFSIVAHDLNNPFSSLMITLDLIVNHFEAFSTEQLISQLDEMKNSVQRIYSLNHNLLTWARSQTGRIQTNFASLHLKELVEETIAVLESTAGHKEIALHLKVDPQLRIYADADLITTVIRNVLTNAIKFTPKGGAVSLEAKKDVADALIQIKDNGVGMTPDVKAKLFAVGDKSFTQGTAGESGTGLGLIIAKEFIEMNHGDISIESEPDQGTVVSIRIPTEKTN
jgi:two-component system, sensor histidine kinase and response regulator